MLPVFFDSPPEHGLSLGRFIQGHMGLGEVEVEVSSPEQARAIISNVKWL